MCNEQPKFKMGRVTARRIFVVVLMNYVEPKKTWVSLYNFHELSVWNSTHGFILFTLRINLWLIQVGLSLHVKDNGLETGSIITARLTKND